MTRLRTTRGLDLELFETKFGKESLTQLMSQAEEFIKRGELKFNKEFLSLTEAGIEISDLIMSSLF